MRPRVLHRPPKQVPLVRTATPIVFPALSQGWNARDPIQDLKPGEAALLDNWLPLEGAVMVRPGIAAHATGLPGAVETLMRWAGGATSELYAVSDGAIYNVSAAGAVGAAAVSGLSASAFDWTNFGNTAGHWLVGVNGADEPRLYNGSSWGTPTTLASAITGVTAADLRLVCAHKGRLWFGEKDSLNAWYLAALAVGGAATKFPLGPLATKGGKLTAVIAWTRDGGAGPDDELVFITSEGQAIVYAGTDPASSSTWALRGVYNIPQPIGMRCAAKSGSDVLILTTDGVHSLAHVAVAAESERDPISRTDKIRNAYRTSAKSYGDVAGWQIVQPDAFGWLMINVPLSSAGPSWQFVRSGPRAAWCRFTGWSAVCFAEYSGKLYLGAVDGQVVEVSAAALSDDGEAIAATAAPAFQGLGNDRSTRKHFIGARATFNSDGEVTPAIGLAVDWQDIFPEVASVEISAAGGAEWDVASWDVAEWGDAMRATEQNVDVFAEGKVVSPVVQVLVNGARVSLAQIEVPAERGHFA